jgi:DNA-binding transcriptional LysR family regulator
LHEVGRIKTAVMVRAGHPLTRMNAVTLADLENYPLASAVELQAGMASAEGAFICDNFHILRETVLASDCVWISSPVFLAEDLRAERIAQLDVPELTRDDGEISLVFKRGRTRSPAAMTVEQHIRSMLKETGS